MMSDQAILVTGAAGFIGFHVARRLLAEGHHIVGLDNLNSYYDPALKQSRLDLLRPDSRFRFLQVRSCGSFVDRGRCLQTPVPTVIHLAAQAGGSLLDRPSACLCRHQSRGLRQYPGGLSA